MKVFAEGHTAILWRCRSAALQRCLGDKIVLSPSRVTKGGVQVPSPTLPVFERSEIIWTGEASWLQTSCQINFPCLCMCGAAWQDSAGADERGVLMGSGVLIGPIGVGNVRNGLF